MLPDAKYYAESSDLNQKLFHRSACLSVVFLQKIGNYEPEICQPEVTCFAQPDVKHGLRSSKVESSESYRRC